MRTAAQQKELIARAAKNGIKTYRKAIRQQVGAYDREEVTRIFSQKTFEDMWSAYEYNDTMVRDYVMDIIEEEQNR